MPLFDNLITRAINIIESVKNGKNVKKSVSQVGVPTGIKGEINANKSGNHNRVVPNINTAPKNVAKLIGFILTPNYQKA